MKNKECTCCENWKMFFTKSHAAMKAASVLCLIFAAFLFSTQPVNGQTSIKGVAPVLFPPGGFAVDGNAIANYVPASIYDSAGDWFSDPTYPGPGGTVFNMSTPDPFDLNYPMAYHWNDGWLQGTDLTIFTKRTKIDDPPHTMTWDAGSAPNKNEINNATVQFSWGDPMLPGGNSKDLWCSFAADRMVNNGSSYIDFEFLQQPMYMTGTTSGSFLSLGADSGRTVGDILITIEFQIGGGTAFAVIQRWQTKAGGGFEYVEFTPALGDIYCTSNDVMTEAPWLPFGQSQYDVNQYAEGAINLSHIFNIEQNPCLVLSTVFCRTRTSGSSGTSELKDFPGAPYQVNLDMSNLAVTCPAPVNLSACTSQASVTAAYNTWKGAFGYTGGIVPVTDNIASIPALPGNFACTGGTLNFTYIAIDSCGKTDSCSSSFSVAQPVALVIHCPAPVSLTGCTSQTAIDAAYTAWVAGFTFSGDCNATSNIANIPALPANAHCNGASLSFTFTATGDCGTLSCTSTFNVAQPAALVVNCPTPVNLTGCTSQASIDAAYAAWVAGFTFSGDCNATSNIASIPALPANAHCNGASLSFTFTATGDCGTQSCSSTFNVAQPAALVIHCPPADTIPCSPIDDILTAYNSWRAGFTNSGDCNVTDNMASFPSMTIDPFTGGSISFTYEVSGDCGSLSCTSTFTVLPCAGHIFPTGTSCCNFLQGTAELENVCYKYTDATSTVNNAIPGVFFYYTEVVAPSANFTIDVIQTKDCSGFKYFAVHQGNQIMLFNEDCQRLLSVVPSESGIGQAHLAVSGAIPGATYVMSVKYNVKSIIGSTFVSPAPTCEYEFVSQIGGIDVPNSTGHINAVPGCIDNTPAPGYCYIGPIISPPITNQLEKETSLRIYPNPFNKTTEITFTLVKDENRAVLELVNMFGSKVEKLYEGPADAGIPYTITLKAADNMVEGVYFMVLTTGNDVITQRVILSR